ncbi:MAG TPA: Crp/Fnr family transcriptional regulator [Gammaproteobacteria bacterium]|nr:Crp/Fnr family transcriptional regulator [Gammaproteobacteria bacterium]
MDKRSSLYHHCQSKLRRSPLFARLPETVLDNMLREFRFETWRKGTRRTPGLLARQFYLVLEGRVEITRSAPDTGRSITLFLLGPGDGFDIVTLLDDQPHDAEPLALDDLELLTAPIPAVRTWIERHPEFNREFLPYVGERLRSMESLASDLALHDTATRLARLILHHTQPPVPGSNGDDPAPVRLISGLTHESLARMVGAARQVVNRHLQELRRAGILHGERNHWVVRDLEALRAHAGVILERLQHHRTRRT